MAQLEQLEEAVAPVVAMYLPVAHSVHSNEPVEAWYMPTEQLVHTEASEAEYDPAGQLVQAVIDPVTALYRPCVQPVQLVAPTELDP